MLREVLYRTSRDPVRYCKPHLIFTLCKCKKRRCGRREQSAHHDFCVAKTLHNQQNGRKHCGRRHHLSDQQRQCKPRDIYYEFDKGCLVCNSNATLTSNLDSCLISPITVETTELQLQILAHTLISSVEN